MEIYKKTPLAAGLLQTISYHTPKGKDKPSYPKVMEMAARSGAKLVWFLTCDNEHERAHTFNGDPNKKLPFWTQIIIQMKEGQGRYCFLNGLLQTQMQKLEKNYRYIVVDNEAGLEHISRGLLPNMEITILVSDCSRCGIQTAGRIA